MIIGVIVVEARATMMMTVPAAFHRHVHGSNPSQKTKPMRQNIRKRPPRASLSLLLCRPLAQQQLQRQDQQSTKKQKQTFRVLQLQQGFHNTGEAVLPVNLNIKTKKRTSTFLSRRPTCDGQSSALRPYENLSLPTVVAYWFSHNESPGAADSAGAVLQ